MARVPHNKLLTNLHCSSRTGEYWPLVVFSMRSVRTATTSGQYSPILYSPCARLVRGYYWPNLFGQDMCYWPSVRSRWLDIGQVHFFACLWTEMESRSILSQKKRGQYPDILTEDAWTIKDLLHGFPGDFSCGTQREVPSGQDSSIPLARVANHSARFGSSSSRVTELAI